MTSQQKRGNVPRPKKEKAVPAAGQPFMAEPDFGTGKNVVLPFPSAQGRTLSFFPERTNRPARRRPGPYLADRAGRQAGALADRTTRRLGGRKAGESAETDLPGSATAVLARSERQITRWRAESRV